MSRMKRMAEQGGLLETFRADGSTYDPAQDQRRLGKQAQDVWDFMTGNYAYAGSLPEQWHPLIEVAIRTGHPEGSVSARLRDFRKPRFGSHTVERRRRKGSAGTWEYRLKVNTGEGEC